MEGKRRSPRVDIAIGARLDFREKGTYEGIVENLSTSGEGIMVRSSREALVGETVTLEMPVPIKMETVRCRGEVIDCQESGGKKAGCLCPNNRTDSEHLLVGRKGGNG